MYSSSKDDGLIIPKSGTVQLVGTSNNVIGILYITKFDELSNKNIISKHSVKV
jgi:hypothetical protein